MPPIFHDADLARQLDAADPLGRFRDAFVISEPDLLYMDGNSLGRLPKRTVTPDAVGRAGAVGRAPDPLVGRGLVLPPRAAWEIRSPGW